MCDCFNDREIAALKALAQEKMNELTSEQEMELARIANDVERGY